MTTRADKHIGDHGVATAAAGAANIQTVVGQITSESLVTATGALYTLTIVGRHFQADSVVMASVRLGTSTQGTPQIVSVTPSGLPGAGQVVIVVKNIDATNAFNGTIVVSFLSI